MKRATVKLSDSMLSRLLKGESVVIRLPDVEIALEISDEAKVKHTHNNVIDEISKIMNRAKGK